MTAIPELITKSGFEIVYGTDLQREGSFLELGRRVSGTWHVVAELFSPEQAGSLILSMEEELPVEIIETFIEYGRARLAPPGWGSRLTSA